LLSLAVFVSATMISQPDGNYEVSINLREGWNIIAGTVPEDAILSTSEIQLSDIKAMWYYSPKTNEYIRVYPNPETSKLQQADDDIVLTSAMWIYSEKSGTLKYDTLEDYPPLENRQLFAGYNFLTISEDMTIDVNTASPEEEEQYTLNNLKGNCNFEKVYHFEQSIQEWSPNLANDDFMDEELNSDIAGLGILVKVSSDCNLGKINEGEDTTPPQIPGGTSGSGDCTDSDGGMNYGTRGQNTGLYTDPLTNEERNENVRDVCLGDPETSQSDIDYYLERGFISESQATNDDVLIEYYCVGNSIELNNYECPNGCSNGACL